MRYKQVVQGTLIKRMNRFVAEVSINDSVERVHVKNTGRLKELLYPDNKVLLEKSNNPKRTTNYSIIAANKNDKWINIDSQAPNAVIFEALKEGKIKEIGKVDFLKKEVTFGESRFDFYYENGDEKGFIEVKGVTLERNEVASFPDAPTLRGMKHVLEMCQAVQEGYKGTILFVIQMKGCKSFTPNREMDPNFADRLLQAAQQGVQIIAYDSIVEEDSLFIDKQIPVSLI
ncbi:DNA/RNA nuclease SfsA [Lysinibacillus endophyticus]|uniref:Sugar fermentation stimulation protein homolog n=1 Tax=Ureibacillus endophyticus TaxID=1978490 RepID=A0A494YYS8_9BACL|nr:DNA/RNA nuclease SfsA [Lysinibacillus endophyticus]MCP1146557.1 DNA/RNA nuclease SfsA [Lysinibacillus endophyticus]RKQ15322.1 DNA/RNA nuclease SfsA [Lysinibacillus endophyticus]